MKFGIMLMNYKVFVFIVFFSALVMKVKANDSIYVVLKVVDEYDSKESYSSYWIIPTQDIKNNHYEIVPLFIDTLNYNIVDYPQDSIPFLRDNFTVNEDYKHFLDAFLNNLTLCEYKIQEIKKKWFIKYHHFDSYIGKPNNRTIYMSVVQGCFEKRHILFSNLYNRFIQRVVFYIPISYSKVNISLTSNNYLRIFELSDFSYINPYELIPKEMTNYKILPIIPN